jgi:two-component SAPR family response regulator
LSQFWHAFAADLYRQVPDSDSARVIIFHPVLPYKRFVLSRLLTDSVYVRLHGQGLDVDAVRHQIDLMVAHQKPPPGKSLVVDEGDRIEAAAFMDYVRDFLSSSYFVRLFIFLRTLHAELDTALGAGGDPQVILLRHPESKRSVQPPEERKSVLDVFGFGRGQVFVNGRHITRWDGEQTRKLCFLLIDHAGGISREQIVERLWNATTLKKATNLFHVTKTKLKENLFEGQEDKPDLVHNVRGVYRISSSIYLNYDVAEFEALLERLEGLPDHHADAGLLLSHVLCLSRRDFLTGFRDGWVRQRRDTLRRRKAVLLMRMARRALASGDQHGALAFLLRAASLDPVREDIARQAIELCRDLRRSAEAGRIFARYAQELDRQYQLAPSAELRALVETIRRQMP